MKVTHIGHACILIEAGGVALLSDPWWRGPCFGSQWWLYPQPHLAALQDKNLDYIYISHGHNDHFHPGTLKTLLATNAKVIVSARTGLAESVRALGFEVVTAPDLDELPLGENLRTRVIETDGGDTLMVVSDGEETCVNLNDALHSAPASVQDRFIRLLLGLYPKIDYVFCGYGVASHFPNCYAIPGKDDARTAGTRQQHFNRQWARIIAGLEPRFAFPFAADVVLLEDDLFWANEPTHNTERPTEAFRALHPQTRTQALDIAPGFAIERGNVVRDAPRAKVSAEALRAELREEIARANRYSDVSDEDVANLVALIQKNIRTCGACLAEYPTDWRCLIDLRGSRKGIGIEKRGSRIEALAVEQAAYAGYQLSYSVRPAYLKRSLTEPYGAEILFVGSGGVFRYTSEPAARANLHSELKMLLRQHSGAPRSRFGDQPQWVYRLKHALKGLAAREDLYDLGQWVVLK